MSAPMRSAKPRPAMSAEMPLMIASSASAAPLPPLEISSKKMFTPLSRVGMLLASTARIGPDA
jgi:hypothetical protein